MSAGSKEIQELERKIADGTVPPCPLCRQRILVGRKQEGASGAVAFQYKCQNRDCGLPPGHAYTPWHAVLLKALQKRAVQLTLAAIGSITITGAIGFATGLINWKPTVVSESPCQGSDFICLKYYPDSNEFLRIRDTGLLSHISKAQEEIWFVGVAFHVTLSDGDIRKLLLQKLTDGVSVKFLIYDPTSPNLPLVAQRYGREHARNLASDSGTTIKYLSEIYDTARARKLKKNLEIKLYRDIPQSRLYIFDRNNPNGHTYFIPHIGQYRSPELPGYLFQNESVAKEYRAAVISLWDGSEDAGVSTFEAWVGKPETKAWLAGGEADGQAPQ